MNTKHIDPTPDNFKSYEEAAEFWDAHDTVDYQDEFQTIDVHSELRVRHFEVEIDENVVRVLQAQAKERGVELSELASELLRRQLGMAA